MTVARPILIIDDDPNHSAIPTKDISSFAEFGIDVAAIPAKANEILQAQDARFNAVIVNFGMPDGDGQDDRARLCRMPNIVLTGAGNE